MDAVFGIVMLGFGGLERIPYALMQTIDEEGQGLWAAEDGEPNE